MNKLLLILLTATCLFPSCLNNDSIERPNQQTSGASLFTLLPASKTGIDFNNTLVEDVKDETKNILSFEYYYNGGGVAIGDINNDSLEDVFLTGNEVKNRLYLNKGNMIFEDISDKAGINVGKNWSTGVTMADVNGDGNLDIYVCQGGSPIVPWSKKANLLFINNGDGTFQEKAKEYGLEDTNISSMAAFFDYDKDGDLDCFVLNESKYYLTIHKVVFEELKKPENRFRSSSNLFRNDNGKFVNVTEKAGMQHWHFGLGLAVSDFNEDGWPDVYVANDYSVPDNMFINNGDGTFTDRIKEKTKQLSFSAMGIDVGDINNDGFQEIGVVDMAIRDHVLAKTLMAPMNTDMFWYYINHLDYHYQYNFNVLQLNNGNGTYSNVANMVGLAESGWSWAALLMDMDNDGYKDYYVTNGYRRYSRDNDFRLEMQRMREKNGGTIPMSMRQEFYDKMPSIKLSNLAYHNNGKLKFEDKATEWGLDQASFSNGAAYSDLDNDGDLDLVVNNVEDEAFVYRNNSREINGNHFLSVRLKGRTLKSPLTNTLVSIYYNDEKQLQECMNTRGYQSAVGNTLHFGLGETEKIEKLEVVWPDGSIQIMNDIKADQFLNLDQSNAINEEKEVVNSSKPYMEEIDPKDLGIDFIHVENPFNDFQKQFLLPHKQSALGPMLSVADANGDGLDDFYVGGAAGQIGALYFQNSDGTFSKAPSESFQLDFNREDMGVLFFDADNNGNEDMYIVSGGGAEYKANSQFLQDRIYINTGQGNYQKAKGPLPDMFTSSSVAKAADFDGDGDMDLFVGGRAVPAKYPYPERSYLLMFDNFKYHDVTEQFAPELMNPGIVTDAIWTDFNKDGKQDLIIVGEWMPISFYQNEGTSFKNVSDSMVSDPLKGWWYSIAAADIDQDGDMDYICGNLGTNSKFSASKKKPFKVFAEDFDGNGTCDIVLSKEYKGRAVPTRGRECSSQQMPFITVKFPTYHEYANADLNEILGKENLAKSIKLEVTGFESIVLKNDGQGHFDIQALPFHAQRSPINGILTEDIDRDGNLDLIVAGNMYDTEVDTPRYDAGIGTILKGDGKGGFETLTIAQSGFYASGNVKDIDMLSQANGDKLVLVSNNNGPLQIFRIHRDVE